MSYLMARECARAYSEVRCVALQGRSTAVDGTKERDPQWLTAIG